MECKTCGKKYHWCSSCGSCHPEDIGFCSNGCWKSSEEYCEIYTKFQSMIESMNNKQLGILNWLFVEVNLDKYYGIFEKMILDKFKQAE